jgi:uncharacterized protein
MASAAVAAAYRARHAAPYAPVLERIEQRTPLGATRAAGLRIGFVTDLHIGSVIRVEDVDRAMQLLFGEKPDLLLLAGDFICDSPRYAVEAAAVLGPYAALAPLGALAVLGNHDHANGAQRLTSSLGRQNIRVLCNEATAVRLSSVELWIVGIDDAVLGFPHPARAFAMVPPDASALALWHEPDWAAESARHGAFMQLSGHSHGGQVRLPFLGPIAAPPGGQRFIAGLNHAAGMPVYTSRGVGVYRPPVRVRCRPEVTLLQLI